VTASSRHTIRIFVFASALLVALLFAEHEAGAEDIAPVSTPAPDPGGDAPPPSLGSPPPLPPVVDPPVVTTPDPAPGPPTEVPPVVPGGSIDLPETVPKPPSSHDPPELPSGPPANPRGESHEQIADVITGGTAVANTGSNRGQATGAFANAESAARPIKELPFSGTTGVIRTGGAHGRGSVDENGIKQDVDAVVTENGKVTVVQVAIIVNVGIGVAGSGRNFAVANATVPVAASVALVLGRGETAAGGGPGTGPTPTLISTGSAVATGNAGATKVTQSIVLTGRDVSSQLASVLNLGVGVANSGLNLALAAVATNNTGAPKSATFVTLGGGSTIGTGPASALGNRSTSAVLQAVTVTASGNGNLLVVQRAVIVNFGLALANTGLNAAGGVGLNAALPEVGNAQALLLSLLGAGPDAAGPELLGGVGGESTIGTGLARAIGNSTKTGIIQKIEGSVSGDDTAKAIQDAWVGNFGVGIANSGGNGAGGLSGPATPSLAAARDALRAFLGGLTGVGQPVQGLDASFQLGADLLSLQGDVSGTETLLGVGEGTATPGDAAALVVRQVTAVLNIGIALGDSGHNVATASRVSTGTTTVGGPDAKNASVTITTGDARAVGSRFATTICQAIGDELTCAPPVTPETPENPPPENPPEVPPGQPPLQAPVPGIDVRPTVAIATLPFTGSPIGAELAAGSTLLIAGMLMARRRRQGARR
jgi:hypothetical protein